MVRRLLDRLRAAGTVVPEAPSRPKLFFDSRPDFIYAIGDIHGCLSLLKKMEKAILEDAASVEGEKWIVLLGDYVDRGPESAGVLDHLTHAPPEGLKRFCLAGNHEELMLSYLSRPDPSHLWLGLGGRDTLRSYGIGEASERKTSMRSLLESHVPSEHLDFLRTAPALLAVPGYVFVHGGLRNGVPPPQQADADLLWLRPDTTNTPHEDFVLIHGHTPVREVEMIAGRINVDTGAYASGILSCVRIDRSNKIVKLATR
jgi:Calcineurin-like phosphoesterase.